MRISRSSISSCRRNSPTTTASSPASSSRRSRRCATPTAAAIWCPTGEPDQHFACDDVLVAVGQENAFPWIERDCGIEFDKWDMPKVDTTTMASTNPKIFFGGDAAFGPKNIIWAVAHGHEAAISIDRFCRGEDVNVRPAPQIKIASQKMGIHEWSYDNEITLDKRYPRAASRQSRGAARHQGRGRARLRSRTRA